jgi:hypothetical protein
MQSPLTTTRRSPGTGTSEPLYKVHRGNETADRTQAYGRAMRALGSPQGMERLTDDQRDVMRDTADTLVLSSTCDSDTEEAMLAGSNCC